MQRKVGTRKVRQWIFVKFDVSGLQLCVSLVGYDMFFLPPHIFQSLSIFSNAYIHSHHQFDVDDSCPGNRPRLWSQWSITESIGEIFLKCITLVIGHNYSPVWGMSSRVPLAPMSQWKPIRIWTFGLHAPSSFWGLVLMLLSNFKGPGYGHNGLLLLLRAPKIGGWEWGGQGRVIKGKCASGGECSGLGWKQWKGNEIGERKTRSGRVWRFDLTWTSIEAATLSTIFRWNVQ